MSNRKYDIHERIFKYIVDVVKLVNSLPKTLANQVSTYQILKSVTSVGANDQEAGGASSKKRICSPVRYCEEGRKRNSLLA